MLGLTISTDRPADGTAVVTLTGPLDVYTAADARNALMDLVNLESRYRQVVDLSGVDFIDSTGLGVLVGQLKRNRARGGTLVLVVEAASSVSKALRVTGVHKAFDVRYTLDEALARLAEAAGQSASEDRPSRAESAAADRAMVERTVRLRRRPVTLNEDELRLVYALLQRDASDESLCVLQAVDGIAGTHAEHDHAAHTALSKVADALAEINDTVKAGA